MGQGFVGKGTQERPGWRGPRKFCPGLRAKEASIKLESGGRGDERSVVVAVRLCSSLQPSSIPRGEGMREKRPYDIWRNPEVPGEEKDKEWDSTILLF